MEKKVIQIEVKTGQANKAIDDLTNSVTDLNASFEDVYGELQPLSGRMGELEDRLYELALAGKTNTKEYRDLEKEVAKFKRVITETDLAVDSASVTFSQKMTTSISGVASAFEFGQGAMATFGVSSQELEATLLKVQSAMAMSQGLQGIKEAIPTFKALGQSAVTTFQNMTAASKAFMVTGIGLLLTAIGTAVAYWDDLEKALGKTDIAQDAYNDTLDEYRQGAQDAITKTRKVSDSFRLAKEGVISKKEALEIYNTELGGTLGKAKSLNEAEDIYNKKVDAYIKSTMLRAQANAIAQKSAEKFAEAMTVQMEDNLSTSDVVGLAWENMFESNEKIAESAIKKNKERAKEARKEKLAEKKVLDELSFALLKEAEKLEKQNNILSETEQKLKSERKDNSKEREKQLAREKQNLQDIIDIENEQIQKEIDKDNRRKQRQDELAQGITDANKLQRDYLLDEQEKELQAIEDKYRRLDDLAEEFGYGQQELLEARLNEENDIKLKYAQMEIDQNEAKNKQIEEDEKRLNEAKINIVASGLSAVSDLIGAFTARNKKQAKAQFNAQKALGIASAIVDTYKGAQSAFASTPGGIVIKTIAAGVAVTAGLANVAKIAKTKFEDTSAQGGTGGVSIPQGATQTTTTPNFNVVGNSGVNQLATLTQQPVQAYVVSGQVTTAQALDRNRIQNATL